MTFSVDRFFRGKGTRFQLFAQSPVLAGFERPEPVWISSPRGSLRPGPADRRMYAIAPYRKRPYGETEMPPYRGPAAAPVAADPQGHFDHVAVDDPGFEAVHMFGSVRRVLDIWEMYLGGPFSWHFALTHPRLELVAHVRWDNAHFGWGYMECGEGADDQGAAWPYALNFDVLAHEVGHAIVFSLAGMPVRMTSAYRGFSESAADCVAMISALHFKQFVEHVLRVTSGDLYVANEMNRIGELSPTRQIRIASNGLKLRDVTVDKPLADMSGKEVHRLGQPLTGAVFDILAEFFVHRLIVRAAVPRDLAVAFRRDADAGWLEPDAQHPCKPFYRDNPGAFAAALSDARDMVGLRLAEAWRWMSPEDFSFDRFARDFLAVDRRMSGAAHQARIVRCFRWRGIGPG